MRGQVRANVRLAPISGRHWVESLRPEDGLEAMIAAATRWPDEVVELEHAGVEVARDLLSEAGQGLADARCHCRRVLEPCSRTADDVPTGPPVPAATRSHRQGLRRTPTQQWRGAAGHAPATANPMSGNRRPASLPVMSQNERNRREWGAPARTAEPTVVVGQCRRCGTMGCHLEEWMCVHTRPVRLHGASKVMRIVGAL